MQYFSLPADFKPLTETLARTQSRPVILLDGGSGVGKSTLANRLHTALAPVMPGLQLVHIEDFVPGWDGLAAGSKTLSDSVLRAHNPGYRRWDWHQNRFAEWVELDPDAPLLVEGCGTITSASVRLATAAIWYERSEPQRKALAAQREENLDWWPGWAAQEQAHWRANRPQVIADFTVHGDSRLVC